MFACLGKKTPGQTCIVPVGFGFEIRAWNCQRRLTRKEETTLPETGEGGTRTRESSHARLAYRNDRAPARSRTRGGGNGNGNTGGGVGNGNENEGRHLE
jgi:hypothetical protein